MMARRSTTSFMLIKYYEPALVTFRFIVSRKIIILKASWKAFKNVVKLSKRGRFEEFSYGLLVLPESLLLLFFWKMEEEEEEVTKIMNKDNKN